VEMYDQAATTKVGPSGKGGAGRPPLGPTGLALDLTWPPRTVDTHGDTYISAFPL
jgi:hypothetical protein